MVTVKPRIAISLRIVNAVNYEEKRDALSHDWPVFLEKLGFNPIFVPNVLSDVASFLTDMKIDGIVLSGGDNIGDDPKRDKTETTMLEFATKNNIPLIGICRGMQIINDYFGGTIEKSQNNDHVGKHHLVEITNKKLSSLLNTSSLQVNSYHHNLIRTNHLGKNLEPFAITRIDNTVEGFFHATMPLMGIMWHPEREQNNSNQLLIKTMLESSHDPK